MNFESQQQAYKKINHFFRVFRDSDASIRPHFHLTGPTGSGKTYLVKQVANELEIPYLEINAANITSEGVAGNSLSKAMKPLRTAGSDPHIVFVDEFDKLFLQNGTNTENWVSSVQDEFLKAVEGETFSVFGDYGNYDNIRIDNLLFVFAGSYGGAKMEDESAFKNVGIRPEFMGRVPLFFHVNAPDVSELVAAVPFSELFQEYCSLYRLKPEQENQMMEIIQQDIFEASKLHPIGARLINSRIHKVFMEADVPTPGTKVKTQPAIRHRAKQTLLGDLQAL